MPILKFTEAELMTAFLVFVRTLALFVANPLFGNNNIPVRIRIITGLWVGMVLLPMVPTSPGLSFGLAELTSRVIHEAFIGVSMGFLVTVLFSLVAVAGHVMSSASGITMSQLFDPSLQTQVTVLGSMKTVLLFLVFLGADLHHILIRGLAASFASIPPGGGGSGIRAGFYMVKLFTTVLQGALSIALPVLLVVFVINLAMAIIARIAPQMNVFFSVGNVINEQAALLVLSMSLPAIAALILSLMGDLDVHLTELIRQFL